jgi:hypothetical protein
MTYSYLLPLAIVFGLLCVGVVMLIWMKPKKRGFLYREFKESRTWVEFDPVTKIKTNCSKITVVREQI